MSLKDLKGRSSYRSQAFRLHEIIEIIEREEIILKILKHVRLREVTSKLLPKIHSPPAELHADYSHSQISPWCDDQTAVSHPTYCIPHLFTENQFYLEESIVGGKNICCYEINLVVKTF